MVWSVHVACDKLLSFRCNTDTQCYPIHMPQSPSLDSIACSCCAVQLWNTYFILEKLNTVYKASLENIPSGSFNYFNNPFPLYCILFNGLISRGELHMSKCLSIVYMYKNINTPWKDLVLFTGLYIHFEECLSSDKIWAFQKYQMLPVPWSLVEHHFTLFNC